MSHWKNYTPIDQVPMLDGDGAGPMFERLQVTANVHPSDAYPEQRVQIHLGGLASAGLTIEQSAQFRAILEQAERDVRAGVDGDPPEVSCG